VETIGSIGAMRRRSPAVNAGLVWRSTVAAAEPFEDSLRPRRQPRGVEQCGIEREYRNER
jgi:hypothetical protein